MKTLNESVESLPSQWAMEFMGEPERFLLPAGAKLCKRVTSQAEFNRLSEWWMLKSDWDTQTQRAVAIAVQPAQMVRAQQAVRNDWQPNLEQIVHAQLMQPVYAWAGRARWQPFTSNDPRVILIGGGHQICIPNLTNLHIRVLHSVATTVAVTNTISLIRKWETAESTIGEFTIPQAVDGEFNHGYILERPGPDTIQSGQRKRIPDGTYQLKWQTTTGLAGVRPYLPVPWLYNAQVSDSRMIYIHNGNYPKNTDGCLLIGKTRSKDMVGSSVDALKGLKKYLERVGIENVLLRITSSYL